MTTRMESMPGQLVTATWPSSNLPPTPELLELATQPSVTVAYERGEVSLSLPGGSRAEGGWARLGLKGVRWIALFLLEALLIPITGSRPFKWSVLEPLSDRVARIWLRSPERG